MSEALSKKKDFPHEGWQWHGVRDLLLEPLKNRARQATCEYCGKEKVRYLHSLQHPRTGWRLQVGLHCAHKLSDDPNLEQKEGELRQHAQRRMNFPKLKGWRKSAQGNEWIEYHDHHVVIVPWGPNHYRLRIDGELGKMNFKEVNTAKLRAYDVLARKLQRESWTPPAAED